MNDGDDEKPVDQPFDEIRFVIPKYGATLQQSPHHGNLITNKLKALSLSPVPRTWIKRGQPVKPETILIR